MAETDFPARLECKLRTFQEVMFRRSGFGIFRVDTEKRLDGISQGVVLSCGLVLLWMVPYEPIGCFLARLIDLVTSVVGLVFQTGEWLVGVFDSVSGLMISLRWSR